MWPKDYIQGNRRGKEANRLERKALNDPFMQDALDGFDTVTGDHVKIIELLEQKYSTPVVAPQPNRRMFLYRSIAASILLLIGFGAYFFWERNKNDVLVIAKVQSIENDSIIPVDSPVSQLVQIEELQQKTVVVDKVNKKVTPIPTPTYSSPTPNIDENLSSSLSENDFVTTGQDYLPEQSETPAADESSAKIEVKEQERKVIRGKVVDETGELLIGVSIMEKGTSNGTVTDINGTFTLQLSKDDSSKLIASYLGYEAQEIKPLDTDQTVTLKPNNLALNEVVVVGYGAQKKSTLTGAIAKIRTKQTEKSDSGQKAFGEKEFQAYCQQKADKNICDGQSATVKVSFFIDETGKPSEIEYKNFSCEEAKKEMENLLSSSPVWTKTNRRVTMTIKLEAVSKERR